jgi:hypothetical protein
MPATGYDRGVILWIVVMTAVAFSLRRVFLGYPSPRTQLRVIARRDAAFLEAAAEAMFPAGGALALSGRDVDLPGFVDGYLAALPPHLRLQIRALFLLVEQATLVFPPPGPWRFRRFRRFSALTPEQRVAVFEGWTGSRLSARRLVFTALRAVLTMGYLGHPAVLRLLRLAPYDIRTPVCEADLLYPRVGAHPDSIELTRADLTPPSDGRPIELDGPLHPDFAGPDPGSADAGGLRARVAEETS